MKKLLITCLFMVYGTLHPSQEDLIYINFMGAYQTTLSLYLTISMDEDDIRATHLLHIMEGCVHFDTTLQKSKLKNIPILRAENQATFQQTLENYLQSFGQVITTKKLVTIRSKYNDQQPITPKEFDRCAALLKKAEQQFGTSIKVQLADRSIKPVTLTELIQYTTIDAKNKPSSWMSNAMAASSLAIPLMLVLSSYAATRKL